MFRPAAIPGLIEPGNFGAALVHACTVEDLKLVLATLPNIHVTTIQKEPWATSHPRQSSQNRFPNHANETNRKTTSKIIFHICVITIIKVTRGSNSINAHTQTKVCVLLFAPVGKVKVNYGSTDMCRPQ